VLRPCQVSSMSRPDQKMQQWRGQERGVPWRKGKKKGETRGCQEKLHWVPRPRRRNGAHDGNQCLCMVTTLKASGGDGIPGEKGGVSPTRYAEEFHQRPQGTSGAGGGDLRSPGTLRNQKGLAKRKEKGSTQTASERKPPVEERLTGKNPPASVPKEGGSCEHKGKARPSNTYLEGRRERVKRRGVSGFVVKKSWEKARDSVPGAKGEGWRTRLPLSSASKGKEVPSWKGGREHYHSSQNLLSCTRSGKSPITITTTPTTVGKKRGRSFYRGARKGNSRN